MIRALLLIVLFCLSVPLVQAQSIAEQTKRREEIEKEIAFLDKQLSTTRSRQQASTKELSLIQRKITNRRRLLSQIETDIRHIERQSVSKEREITLLNRELEQLKKNYSHLVYNAYKNRDKTTWVLYLLASRNIEQGYRRWSYLRSYSDAMKNSATLIKKKNIQLETEIAQLAKMREESLSMKKQREQEYRSLAQEERTARTLISQLSRREQEFRKQIAEKRQEVERLNREIERILAAAARERSSEGYVQSETDRLLSDNFESNKGRLPWPVREGVIIEHFGQHNHPVFRNIRLPFNNGINISTTRNAQVMSIFDGVVKQVLVMPGYNQCVLVQHGTYYTFYTKLEQVQVKSGDLVKTGQVLGTLAETEGNSVIHFQLWAGTDKQNPEHWISR